MIFQTFNSDIDNISSKWGLFGKSFYDVFTDIEKRWNNVSKTLQITNDYTLQNITNAWKMENSNPIKFLADDEVVSILDRYNKALDSGAEATAKFLNSGTGNEFMDGFLKDLDGAPATMDKYKVATKNATMAQKTFSASTIATQAAVLALNVAVSMGLSIALSALVKIISEVAQSEENLKDSARELGSELSDTTSSVNDYKDKMEELKGVLSDSSSSFDDVSQARVDLMKIQDELIDKFGTEKVERYTIFGGSFNGITRYHSLMHVGGLNVPENLSCDVILSPMELKIACGGNEFSLQIGKIRNVDYQLDIDEKQYLKSSMAKGIIGAATFGVAGAVIGSAPKTKTKREVKCYAIIAYESSTGEYRNFILRDEYPNSGQCARLVDALRPRINSQVNKVEL